jgi:predicted MFS family arabinose efflux permease
MIFSGLLFTLQNTNLRFVQPYFLQANIPLAAFGILFTCYYVVQGFGSYHAHRIEKKLGFGGTVALFIGFEAAALFFVSWLIGWPGIIILLFFSYGQGLASPLIHDFINVRTPSDKRASVLSFIGVAETAGMLIIAPLLGVLADQQSIQTAFLVSGTGLLFCSIFAFLAITAKRKS